MSLRVRAEPADAEARAVFPAFGCPSGGLWYNSELDQPASTPHLIRCLHCASLNGQSARQCWSCEAELPPGPALAEASFVAGSGAVTGSGMDTDPVTPESGSTPPPHTPMFFGAADGADLPTAPDAVNPASHADAPFSSAPHSAIALDERLAAFSQQQRRAPRRLLGAAAIAAFTVVTAAGAYLIQRPPPFLAMETGLAQRPVAVTVAETPVQAEPVGTHMAGPSRTDALNAVRLDVSAPASIDPLEPAAQPAAAPTAAPPASPAPSPATLTAARSSTTRGTPNTRQTAPAPVSVPIRREPPDTVRPPTPAQPGACTATVAALGLCQAARAQPKE